MKITKSEADNFSKDGVELWNYLKEESSEVDILRVETEKGHLREFYHKESTFLYYVLSGEGTFYLDGTPSEVEPGDLIVAPPETKIYYLGEMELLLVCSPPWSQEKEVTVRQLDENGEPVEDS